MIQGIGELLEEAAKQALGLPENLEKFERLRLLDGLRDFFLLESNLAADILFALQSLESTFKLDASMVNRVRGQFVHDLVLNQVRSMGYKSRLDPRLLTREGVTVELVAAATSELSQEALLSRNPDGTYSSSFMIWTQDIMKFQEKIRKIDGELGQLVTVKSGAYEKAASDYEKLLERVPPIIDTLTLFNEQKIAAALQNRVYAEAKHFQKHHAGKWWTQEMIRDFRQFLRQTMDRLPPELRLESWSS